MRYLKIVVLIGLIIILLAGCIFESDYSRRYGHLPKYSLKDGQIIIDQDIYMLIDWEYSEYGDETIARLDDRDSKGRHNGLVYALNHFSDREFLLYIFETDPGSGWGGKLVFRRSDIDMPELTSENVNSLESVKYSWLSQDEALISELFVALSDEANRLINVEIINESEHYDTIICRNDDWPDFCCRIIMRRHQDEYYAWSEFLGESAAWITMPHGLVEEITGKAK